MSKLKTVISLAAALATLAGPFALVTSSDALAKKHHKTPTSTENKQTPSGGQPGGGAGKS